MIKTMKSPFHCRVMGLRLSRWYSVEVFRYRLSLGFGNYEKFYFWHSGLLKKIRFAFVVGEIILVRLDK